MKLTIYIKLLSNKFTKSIPVTNDNRTRSIFLSLPNEKSTFLIIRVNALYIIIKNEINAMNPFAVVI